MIASRMGPGSLLLLLACLILPLAMSTAAEAQPSGGDPVFQVERLNPGLEAPPPRLDRDTPQSAVETFLELGEIGDFDTAAHLLDLSDIAEEQQAAFGPLLAERLKVVFDRRVWFTWSDLPDRPDGLDAFTTDRDPMAGSPRRSIRLALIDMEGAPVAVRLNRVKAGDADPVWVFSSRTVQNINRLYERFGPGDLEQSLPEWMQKEAGFGLRWWEIIAIPFMLAGSILVGWLVYAVLGRLSSPIETASIQGAIRRARLPIALFLTFLLLDVLTTSLLSFSGPVGAVVRPTIIALMIAAIALALLRMIDAVLDKVARDHVGDIDYEENAGDRRLYTNISVARRVVLLIAVIAGVGILLAQFNVFQTLGFSLLASAGVASVIVGLAAQTVLGNIMSSLQIAMAKPIRIGDCVYYEGHWGYVEEINYTFVLIRRWDHRRVVVPVKYFVSNPFENWSIRDSHLTRTVDIKVDHGTDVDRLRDRFAELLKDDEDWDGEEEPKTLVTDHDDESKTVTFYMSAADASAAWRLHCRMREKLLAFIDGEDGPTWPRERVLLLDGGRAQDRDADTSSDKTGDPKPRDRSDADPAWTEANLDEGGPDSGESGEKG